MWRSVILKFINQPNNCEKYREELRPAQLHKTHQYIGLAGLLPFLFGSEALLIVGAFVRREKLIECVTSSAKALRNRGFGRK